MIDANAPQGTEVWWVEPLLFGIPIRAKVWRRRAGDDIYFVEAPPGVELHAVPADELYATRYAAEAAAREFATTRTACLSALLRTSPHFREFAAKALKQWREEVFSKMCGEPCEQPPKEVPA